MTAYLRDVEAGAAAFSEALAEWLGGCEAPGVLVLEVRALPFLPRARGRERARAAFEEG